MTTKIRTQRLPFPLWIVGLLVLIIVLIVAIVYLGAGNLVNGLVAVANLIFITPLEWGVLGLYNAMLVVGGLVFGTLILTFLWTKRRYIRGQTIEVPTTGGLGYIPRGSTIQEAALPVPPKKEETAA